jgi:hypothetical protein
LKILEVGLKSFEAFFFKSYQRIRKQKKKKERKRKKKKERNRKKGQKAAGTKPAQASIQPTAHPGLFPNCYTTLSFLPLTALAHLSVVFLPGQESYETTDAPPSVRLSPCPKTLTPSPS